MAFVALDPHKGLEHRVCAYPACVTAKALHALSAKGVSFLAAIRVIDKRTAIRQRVVTDLTGLFDRSQALCAANTFFFFGARWHQRIMR